jgi:sterol desaturase/sphingolipid hydroxylase (fatty acid hydroxylase superfamily)
MWALLLRQFIQVFFTAFTHAHYRLPERLNRIVSLVFVTPNVHHVHHHAVQPYTDANYGDVLSIWDRLFGTYRELEAEKVVFGIDNYIKPGETEQLFFLMKFPFKQGDDPE